MGKRDVVKGAVVAVSEIILSDKGKRFLCGEYTDGTTRSLPDAITGEIISPKDRAAYKNGKKEKGSFCGGMKSITEKNWGSCRLWK